MEIITGYKGEPHITEQQDRDINMGVFGNGLQIVNIGSKLAATIVSANEVTIADGLLIADGCAAEVPRGTSESMTIENGSQGMRRIDLIAARYTKDSSTAIEDMELAVITGTPAASNPAVPSYTTGSIENGDTLAEFPLYRISIDGITIESVTRIPNIVTMAKMSDVSAVSSALSTLSNTVTTLSNKIGNTAMGTAATTVTGAVKELLTKINTLTSNLATTNTNLNTQKGRIDTLVSKTSGLVSFDTSNVSANSNGYRQLTALGMYLVMVNGATTDNGIRGMYLVGTTTGNALGIKAISTASNVTLSDGGSGLLKIANASSVTVRLTIIRVY
jgi:hypothetical protein